MIIAVIYATFAVAKRKPEEKNQACTGFESLTSAIPVQRSTDYANKPTGSRSLNSFVINPWTDDDEVGPTMLGVNVGSCCVRLGNGMQMDDCWDLQCIVGRIWPRRLSRPFVIRVRSPSCWRSCANGPLYTSVITEQKKCWELSAQSLTGFKLCATTPNNTQQHATECADGRNMWHPAMLGVVGQQSRVRLQEA